MQLARHHNKSKHSVTRDEGCDLKVVLGNKSSNKTYGLLSESEIKRLDNIGLSDICKKSNKKIKIKKVLWQVKPTVNNLCHLLDIITID